MKPISIIWLLFTFLFLYLTVYHYNQSKHKYPAFKLTERTFDDPQSGFKITAEIAGSPIDKPLQDFTTDFNKYLNNQNESNKKQNMASARGYFIAMLTAFLCFLLTFEQIEKYVQKKQDHNYPYYFKKFYSKIWGKSGNDKAKPDKKP